MPTPAPEPRNPLYLLLLLVSLLFVLTALGYAVVPILEDKAVQAGAQVPSSSFRDALRKNGWKWLLYELAGMIVVGTASMWLDRQRLRGLQNEAGQGKMPAQAATTSPDSRVDHENPGSTDRGTAQADQPS
jgi:Na+/proline symporter